MLRLPETYIICGANSMIGSHLARRLVDEVQNLVLCYHENTDRIVDLFTCKNVYHFALDITDFDSLQSDFRKLKCELDIKDLGAVFFPAVRSEDHQPLADTCLDLTRKIIDVNLLGSIHFLKAVLTLNKDINSTRIVLLGSNVSRTGLKYGAVYAATKAAMANLVRSVSMEEGLNRTLVNILSPGPVESEIKHAREDYAQFRTEYFETKRLQTSLNKLATPDDVCSMIWYLTSLENGYITGEEIYLTGGGM